MLWSPPLLKGETVELSMRDRLFVWLPSSVIPGSTWRKKEPIELANPQHDRAARLSSDPVEHTARGTREEGSGGRKR